MAGTTTSKQDWKTIAARLNACLLKYASPDLERRANDFELSRASEAFKLIVDYQKLEDNDTT